MAREMDSFSRRELIRLISILGGSAVLSGCNSSDTDSEQTDTPEKTLQSEETTSIKTQRETTPGESTPETTEREEAKSVLGVSTNQATAVERISANLTGSLERIEGYDSANLYFEFGQTNRGRRTSTENNLNAPGEFTARVSNLSPGETYEFQAVVTADADTKRGESRSFTTTAMPKDNETEVWAFYYPWYKGDENWLDRVPGTPVLREYDSRNPDIVRQHFEWSINAGVSAWAINWDQTRYRKDWIDEFFLPSEYSDILGYFMQPATLGRFTWENGVVDLDREDNRQVLKDDFQFFSERYFGTEPYVHVDGRPVLYWFAAGSFRGDVERAFVEAEQTIQEDIYHIIDIPAQVTMELHAGRFSHFDAIGPYNPYDAEWVEKYEFDEYLDNVIDEYQKYSFAADHAGIEFYPTVIPGYDETEIDSRTRHAPPLEPRPERFEQFCQRAPRTMHNDRQAVFVTSFNEWPEFTAVESNRQHGEAYLNIIDETLVRETVSPISESYISLKLLFNKAVNLAGARPLSLLLGKLILAGDAGPIRQYNIGVPEEEPEAFLEGAYPTEKNSETDPESWRWLGGPTAQTVILMEKPDESISEIILVGKPAVDNEIDAEIVLDGESVGTVAFEERGATADRYTVEIQ